MQEWCRTGNDRNFKFVQNPLVDRTFLQTYVGTSTGGVMKENCQKTLGGRKGPPVSRCICGNFMLSFSVCSNFGTAILQIVLSLMASLRKIRGLSSSGYICFMMGIVCTAAAADFLNLLEKLRIHQVCVPLSDEVVRP